MLDICSVCLCTGVELQTLDEALNNFYNDLCDFATDRYSLHCPTCVYLLRKFYNFKNKCQKANYLLNKWKRESEITRIPLNKIHTQLSPTSLGLSNYTNRAVYCYNGDEYKRSKCDLKNFNGYGEDAAIIPTVVSQNNARLGTDLNSTINGKLDVDNHVTVDEPILAEGQTEQQNHDDGDPNQHINVLLNADTNDNAQTLVPVANKRIHTIELNADAPIFKQYRPLLDEELDEIKGHVKRKLGNCKVKDKHGTVIDADVIINNLNKMHYITCGTILRCCSGKDPLTPEEISTLSQIQKRYGDQYSSVFITKHLATDQEIMEEFKKRETNQKYLQAKYKCTRCFKYFMSEIMMEEHMRFHDPSNPLKCDYCDFRVSISERKLLRAHTRQHRVVYECKLCPLVTSYPSVMQVHFNIHTGVKYPCTECDSVFNSAPTLAAHMNYKHPIVKFICPFCARQFHSKHGLHQHKQKKHRDDLDTVGPPSAKCEQCNIQFISDEVYQDHLRKTHTASGYLFRKRKPCLNRKTPKYTCRVCKHVESSMGALMWHFRGEHPSEECDMKRIALHTHLYLCHQCGKGFKDITSFTDHDNVHTGVRPYACTECPKAFHSRNHLQRHMLYHAPPTYQCKQCDKKFYSQSNLTNHRRIHAGNRRYACELCGKTFLHQFSVNEHVRGVHQQIRRTKKHTKQTTVLEQ